MNRSTVDVRKRDPVAEVLKDLSAGRAIPKERAKEALEHHNASTTVSTCSTSRIKKADEDKVYKVIESNEFKLNEKKEEIANLKQQLKEERSRLSKVAGDKMSEDNPNLADLSDPYRPTRLVESFKQLYDDEWTHAFEDLERTRMPETKIIETLAKVLEAIETFCQRAAIQQFNDMLYENKRVIEALTHPRYRQAADLVTCSNIYEVNHKETMLIETHIKQLRKSLAGASVSGLTQIFAKCDLSKLVDTNIKPCEGINSFVRKAVNILWMMKVQDTPMELTWAKVNDKFDRNLFSQYTRKGNSVDYAVWPGVLLHKDGPLMSKGIVQCKNS